jgi:hypothetical protein
MCCMFYCKGRDAGGLVGLDAVYDKAGVVRILDTHVYSIIYHLLNLILLELRQ